jgi:hypothetical protein
MSAVDGDQDRLEVAEVRLDHPQVALVSRTARDDESVTVAKTRCELGELDAFSEQLSFLSQIPHRVLGERLERFGDPAALFGERVLELVLREHAARGKARAVAIEPRAPDCHQLALVNLVEQICTRSLDQAHAAAHEGERAGIRKAARVRRADVDDNAHARLDKLLGRDAVEVGVVDDRDVVGREAPHEILRSPVELRVSRQLDEAHVDTLERNSRPPSMRCSSSRRSASSSEAMRVCVGSPAIFSTRKWRSATLAICGRCVIVIT